ncbi:signal peptide peptidase SppA [Treponema sp.]|uniref:signal peptide peptidase SppA n=1 Tax=Treponema sp. TaxID=166 RepID=UPI00388F20BC
MKLKKINKGKAVFAAIIIIALYSGLSSLANNSSSSVSDAKPKAEFKSPEKIQDNFVKKFNRNSRPKTPKGNYIARIEIKGVITGAGDTYNQKWIMDTIKELKDDKNNKGIILSVTSPGGGVYEADETYLALMDYKKTTNRPVYAYFKNLAASGGYYIACSSDYIMANRNSLIGSIGVICGQFVDLSELMGKYGIKMKTIHSGRNKIMGSVSEPLTKEQEMIMQSICDEGYDQFVGIVSDGRGMTREEVVKLADGRIYTAKQCMENKLIDSIGSMEDLEDAMKRKEFDFADYEIIDYSYTKPENLYNMFMGAAKQFSKTSIGSSLLPKAIEDKLENKIAFPAYYCDTFN